MEDVQKNYDCKKIDERNLSEGAIKTDALMGPSFGRIILKIFHSFFPSVFGVCNLIQWEPRVICIESLERRKRIQRIISATPKGVHRRGCAADKRASLFYLRARVISFQIKRQGYIFNIFLYRTISVVIYL